MCCVADMIVFEGCPDDGLLGRSSSEDEDAVNASRFPCKVEYFKDKIITKVHFIDTLFNQHFQKQISHFISFQFFHLVSFL
jgi:hypothetical protein